MIKSSNPNNNLTNPDQIEEDRVSEHSLRPTSFNDFVGQKKEIQRLKVYIEAAKKRSESLDHVILYGPPGLGKTTLANIIAKELNVNIKMTSGPILVKAGDLAGVLTNLEDKSVLFIDVSLVERHRMIYAIFEDKIVTEIHALQIQAYTIAEWKKKKISN